MRATRFHCIGVTIHPYIVFLFGFPFGSPFWVRFGTTGLHDGQYGLWLICFSRATTLNLLEPASNGTGICPYTKGCRSFSMEEVSIYLQLSRILFCLTLAAWLFGLVSCWSCKWYCSLEEGTKRKDVAKVSCVHAAVFVLMVLGIAMFHMHQEDFTIKNDLNSTYGASAIFAFIVCSATFITLLMVAAPLLASLFKGRDCCLKSKVVAPDVDRPAFVDDIRRFSALSVATIRRIAMTITFRTQTETTEAPEIIIAQSTRTESPVATAATATMTTMTPGAPSARRTLPRQTSTTSIATQALATRLNDMPVVEIPHPPSYCEGLPSYRSRDDCASALDGNFIIATDSEDINSTRQRQVIPEYSIDTIPPRRRRGSAVSNSSSIVTVLAEFGESPTPSEGADPSTARPPRARSPPPLYDQLTTGPRHHSGNHPDLPTDGHLLLDVAVAPSTPPPSYSVC